MSVAARLHPLDDHPGGWPRQPGPILDWLITGARRLPDGPALLTALAERLVAEGVPLRRASFHMRMLHPQLFAMGLYWQRGAEDVRVFRAEHGIEETDTFLNSPMRVLFEGAGAVRQRLDLPEATLPFPVFEELRGQGVTDYVALPMTFSDGRIHGTTWSSDRPGGFRTGDLTLIEDLLPVVSLLLEIHLNRLIATTLLDTYVGHDAGARILSGQIRRGSGETRHAAIWFCDLRGFTAMAERYDLDELLDALNRYYDCMAEAIDRHGGEILKFIGDAMLAVFPLDARDACRRALQAAVDAQDAMAELNARRREAGEEVLDFGIALHAGEVMYGNIGARHRLDFTVIGPAVNLTARIESISRTAGTNVLLSDTFAGLCDCACRSLGRFSLVGIERPVEIFTLPEDA